MYIEIMKTTTIRVDAIRVSAPILNEDDQADLSGHFGVSDGRLDLILDLDGTARGWPAGEIGYFHIEVGYQGTYELLAIRGGEYTALFSVSDEFVPQCMPGKHFGKYLILDVGPDGRIANWTPSPESVRLAFFGS